MSDPPPAPTDPRAHLRDVVATFDAAASPRTRELLVAAVRHLHEFAADTGLTRGEWEAAIAFLTAVGQACVGDRQEFVLLSDVLGLSMLVEMLGEGAQAGATEASVLGPFYVPGAPAVAFGGSLVTDASLGGEPLTLSGTVRDLAGRAVAGATLELWQVQPNGLYDVQEDPARRTLRGTLTSRADGRYQVRTVRPVDYQVPSDGPVGDLLRASGREPWRAAHLHLKVSAPGCRTLVTHVFDDQSPYLGADAVFGVRGSCLASMQGGECLFDPVLRTAG